MNLVVLVLVTVVVSDPVGAEDMTDVIGTHEKGL